MWNLGNSQIKTTFIWPSAPVFMGVGKSEAVGLTQQLHIQRLARFLPSPLSALSLPTCYHSHPGASNLCWEIRKTHPRRWCETDSRVIHWLFVKNAPVLKAPCPGTGSRENAGDSFLKAPSCFLQRPIKGGSAVAICCLHSACADLSVLWPSQKVFFKAQLQLGPIMQIEMGFFYAPPEACLDLWRQKKARYMFQAACALETNKKKSIDGCRRKWDMGKIKASKMQFVFLWR